MNTFWTGKLMMISQAILINYLLSLILDLFARCFLCETKICDNQQHDDMLYFVTRSASMVSYKENILDQIFFVNKLF